MVNENQTLESRMKPEVKEAICLVDRNRNYLLEQNIIGGGKTLIGKFEDFYDMKYHDETVMISPKGGSITYPVLDIGKENRNKFGKRPCEILEVLSSIQEINKEDICRLKYEQVRDSFRKSKFPATKRFANALIGLIGLIGGPLAATYSIGYCFIQDYSNLIWSVPLTAGLFGLAMYMPFKNSKDYERFNAENYLKESGKTNKLFWDLHKTAKKADTYIDVYKKIFVVEEK